MAAYGMPIVKIINHTNEIMIYECIWDESIARCASNNINKYKSHFQHWHANIPWWRCCTNMHTIYFFLTHITAKKKIWCWNANNTENAFCGIWSSLKASFNLLNDLLVAKYFEREWNLFLHHIGIDIYHTHTHGLWYIMKLMLWWNILSADGKKVIYLHIAVCGPLLCQYQHDYIIWYALRTPFR